MLLQELNAAGLSAAGDVQHLRIPGTPPTPTATPTPSATPSATPTGTPAP